MATPKKPYNRQGGRPVLSKSQRQEYRLTVRYNTELHLRLKALARQSGQKPVEVVRQLIAYGRVKERVKKEHRPVFDLLKGLSDNLNQLTRLAHAKGIERLEKQIASVVQEVRRLLKYLRDDR